MKRVASEFCPNCEATSEIEWDTELQGFKTICPDCGKPLMLCDLCLHDTVTDEYIGGCDYDSKTDSCKHNPPRKEV
jgi:hypothetical protein